MRSRRGIVALTVGAALLALGALGAALALGAADGPSAKQTVVKLRKTGLGRVLVDGRGRTLYLFEKDDFGRSACYGHCATFWPPLLTTGKPHPGAGAHASLLGTTKRTDGRLQVTYAGYPLYFYLKDAKPGQTLGQDVQAFGGGWYVLDAKGRKIEDGRHGGGPAEVEVRKTALGRVLVDDRGRTLYLYTPDRSGTSVCYGQCAAFWPPLLTTGMPHAGTGARASLLGTTKRKDGSLQVTYHGRPLYYFAGDEQAGQTAGQGYHAIWYVLGPTGAEIQKTAATSSGGGGGSTPAPTTTTTTTSDSGGGGAWG